MPRESNPNRLKSFEIYKDNTTLTPRQIAEQLSEKVENIRSWKFKDKWDEKLGLKRRKRGSPKGNKNAVGNNGGAPEGNLNNLQHGDYYDPTKHLEKDFLKKYLPAATKKIIKETVESGMTSLDILWTDIQLQFTAIIRSQKIMYVKSNKEMIKELKKTKVQNEITKDKKTGEKDIDEVYREEEFEFQFAWDRQATFLNAQSKAMTTLHNLINKYEELLNKNWNLATEEQKLRINKLKVEISNISGSDEEQSKEGIQEFIKATTMSEKEINNLFKDDENDEKEEAD